MENPSLVVTLNAEPGPIAVDWGTTALLIIDMQRDFIEPTASARRLATTSRN